MFLQLISLAVMLLLTSFVLPVQLPLEGALTGAWTSILSLFGALTLFLYLQGYLLQRHRQLAERLSHGELLLTLAVAVLYDDLPIQLLTAIPHGIFANTIALGIPLCLYLLFIRIIDHATQIATPSARRKSSGNRQLRFLIPFIFPFATIILFSDLLPLESLSMLTATILLLIPLFVYLLPRLIIHFWECTPLTGPIADQLNALCARAQFSHAGLMQWSLFSGLPNAAIIGIFPQSRYLLITPRLAQGCDIACLEAITAHEIGHAKHHHLLFYQLLLGGGILFCTAAVWWGMVRFECGDPLIEFLAIAGLFVLYFRYIFGFYSRLFERQADLHPLCLGIAPEQMIRALDRIGTLAGGIHEEKSWHHYGIRERMDFLQQVALHPEWAEYHNRRVRRWILGYLLFFIFMMATWWTYA